MSADWESEKDLFFDALTLVGAERAVFLDKACGDDIELREEIERLLSYHVHGREYFRQLEDDLGSADRAPDPLLAANDIVSDRFEIQRFLARGGSAEVYAAFDRDLDESIALKVLRGAWADADSVERFKSEVRLARKIQNQHVCRVHDVGRFERGGVPILFFSMELLEGETLIEYVRRNGALTKSEALKYLRQIADGLEAAHRLGVMHRDLKCANVMLVTQSDGSRKAVLTDFGLAIAGETPKGPLPLAGTPAYMAPEQVTLGEVGQAADIYALGVVAYELVTNHLPFPGDTSMEQAQARLLLDPIPPTKFAPTLGRRWEKAILRCLRREPTQRFQRGQDFIRALDPPLRRNTRLAALVAALLTGAIAWGVSVRRGADSATEDPLIVVPFARTGNAEAWQAEALTDDLAAEFAGIPGMHVIASSTAKRLRDIGTVPADLRRQFRIGTVLSGSIDGAAGRLRIGVQLVDARTGYLMWSHTYEGVGENLPHVEETIVLASVRAMHLNVAPPQVSQIRNRHSEVFAAYRAYSLGQYWMNRRNTQGLQEAIRNFKEAVREDPNYALAFAQLGAAYNLIASRGVMPREDAFRQSNSALTKALALAPDLPEALLIKGSNLQIDNWDWDQAERCFRRSLELAPGLSTAHHWLAGLLSARGRHDEAIAEITQARDIDPLSAPVASSYGALLFRAGRVDEAQRQLEWVVKREPAFLNAKLLLADVESYVGQHQKAIELLQAAVAVEGRATYILGDLGHHLASAGRVDEARAIIRELEARFEGGEGRPSEIAEIYHGLGDSDQACAWLERGIPLRDAGVTVLKVDPTWQSLREFPRFRSLVERLKL